MRFVPRAGQVRHGAWPPGSESRMSAPTPLLSLIVPAYNEGERLPSTLPPVIAFLDAQTYASELIIVNNNSRDNTREVALQFAATRPYIRVIDEMTQSKGAAVHTGMRAATGDHLIIACHIDIRRTARDVIWDFPRALRIDIVDHG